MTLQARTSGWILHGNVSSFPFINLKMQRMSREISSLCLTVLSNSAFQTVFCGLLPVTRSLVKIDELLRESVGIVFMANGSLIGDSIYASLASPENKHSFAFTAIGKQQTFTLHKAMKISFYLFTSLALYSAITKKAISRPTKFQKRFCKMAFGRMLSIC